MAVSQGSPILASDYTAARTAVLTFYRTTMGSNGSITAVAQGDIATATTFNTLITAYNAALARYRTSGCAGTYNSNNRSGARYNNRSNNSTVRNGYNASYYRSGGNGSA